MNSKRMAKSTYSIIDSTAGTCPTLYSPTILPALLTCRRPTHSLPRTTGPPSIATPTTPAPAPATVTA